ncbi:MAG: dual specificity protein phosphatase family protein [Planctomycetales bacterium]|nr:dual specificity protein phosphatase family protein [Planctomycetales bacterium]
MQRCLAIALYLPTLAYNFFLGRVLRARHWWDKVDEQVFLGARPFRSDVSQLKALGITGVVNMCEEYSGPKDLYAKQAIEQLWLPTIDFTHPSREAVEAGAAFIDRHVRQQGRVYVHCKAGRARSATIVLWWLVKYCGYSPGDAQRLLVKSRPHVNPSIDRRPVIVDLYSELLASRSSAQ